MSPTKVAHLFAELKHSPIQFVDNSSAKNANVKLFLKRDDLLHSIISGNKWRKLKHLLLEIETSGCHKIAVMGGAYSNLLHSLAYIGHRLGWSVELFVRGYPQQPLTFMLLDAVRWGAKLHYVDRNSYRELRFKPPKLEQEVFWIGEGGYHPLALKGTVESLMEFGDEFDYIVMATATGTSLAGIAAGIHQRGFRAQAIGISVLNNGEQVSKDIEGLLAQHIRRPKVISGFEFGGYAKSSVQLETFIDDFESHYRVPLEPVYSGKSFYATIQLIEQGYFKPGSRVLLIHCGGLQAKRVFAVDVRDQRSISAQ